MVSVGIIDTLTHLPLGVLKPHLDTAGPYGAGNHILDTWMLGAVVTQVSAAFGVIVQISGAIAPKLGRVIGFSDGVDVSLELYDMRICQLGVLHQLLGGQWIASQVESVRYAPQLFRWVEAAPGRVGLYVEPTWAVDLYYLMVN